MKKLIFVILSAMLLFCGCGKENEEKIYPELDSAIEDINSQTKLQGDYILEITFGDGDVLYSSAGTAKWDREEKTGNLVFDQNYLGTADRVEQFFSDKSLITVQKGSVVEYIRDTSVLLSNFPCFMLLPDDSEKDVTVFSNSVGEAYKFTLADSKSLLQNLIGGDIYLLTSIIIKPQRNKTEYGEVNCTYVLSEGKLSSCRYEFDVKLYDTPVASPEGLPEESKYTLDLHVSAKIAYNGFGDEVVVEKYTTPDEA